VKIARFAIAFLGVLAAARGAHAGAREEAAAKSALKSAHAQHAGKHYARALQILSRAETACEPDQCSPTTLAMLLRDMGTMQVLSGSEDKARGNFSAAMSFDASIDLDPAYASDDVRRVWNDVKSPGSDQPSGDFDHKPPAAQKQGVPLPVYVEYHGSAHPASVVVRYELNGSYRRLELVRVGSGFGNVIPCGAVKLGAVRYYFQGFDGEGLPILESGDKRHPFSVPVKASIDGPLPHLPNHRAPTTCGEGMVEEEEHAEESTSPQPTTPNASKGFARLWIGLSGSIDFTVVPGGSDVCARDPQGNPIDSNWACTSDTPTQGADFPKDATEAATLVQGQSGKVLSGVQGANVRVKATLDYAVTANLLVGVAIGYVANAYQGSVSPKFAPIHVEAHGAWVFGDEPLAHSGFAPYAEIAGGVAEFDTNLTITAEQSTYAGSRPVQAWHVGGPGFVALEGGLRYAFSQRAAFLLGARATLAFGIGVFPAFGPDATLAFGF